MRSAGGRRRPARGRRPRRRECGSGTPAQSAGRRAEAPGRTRAELRRDRRRDPLGFANTLAFSAARGAAPKTGPAKPPKTRALGLWTDLYQLTMAAGYFHRDRATLGAGDVWKAGEAFFKSRSKDQTGGGGLAS